MNVIPQTQNEQLQLDRLAAQRRIYGDAKRLVAAQWLLATVPALLWSLVLVWLPDLKVAATLTALFVTFVDFGLLDPSIKKIRALGARVQEAFDTDVLGLGWNSLRSGKQPPHEVIQQYVRRSGSIEERNKAFRDWYPVVVGDIPLSYARLLCQRTNCHWDATLRRRYAALNLGALCVVVLVVLILGLIRDPSFTSVVLGIVAPISPTVVLLLRQGRDYSSFAEVSERLREHIESIWALALHEKWSDQRLKSEAAAVQSEIFLRRASAPMVFDWLYDRLKSANEQDARAAANRYVMEAKKSLSI
jgi:SMODS-associating 4TM effector domain